MTDPDVDSPPTPLSYSAEELDLLRSGQAVYRSRDLGHSILEGSSAVVATAPTTAVWRQILDFDSYVDYLPYITASETILRESLPGKERVAAFLELTTMGIVTRYRVENYWFPDKGYLNWVMSPKAITPLNRVTGSWLIIPFEGSSEQTLLEYRVMVSIQWWVPGFLQLRAANRGLPTIVALIKKRAENHLG